MNLASRSESDATPSFFSAWMFVAFPAVAVMLGWGLRGHIGGGPFGAMIPGCFLALSLSLLLRHDAATAAMVALFGTLGIAYGGEMTYGQTLGLAKAPESFYWGMLGVTLKGAVWGLLGGAVLGVGLSRDAWRRRHLVVAFLLTLPTFFLGWKLINEPRLIYFSDPINRPRDESWAGLLLAALVFLACVYRWGEKARRDIPLRFALWGTLGGAVGFGGGTLFLVYGPALPVPQQWFGWWKAMEFFFGMALGAAFGACAYLNRERIGTASVASLRAIGRVWPILGLLLLIPVFFGLFPLLETAFNDLPTNAGTLAARYTMRVAYDFVFFGAICVFLGLRSTAAAWQIAITVTFFHTMVDLTRDMTFDFGVEGPPAVKAAILLIPTLAMALLVWRLQCRSRPIAPLYLLVVWACYAVTCVKMFGHRDFYNPLPGRPGGLALLLQNHPSSIPVHAVFTLTAIGATLFILYTARKAAREA